GYFTGKVDGYFGEDTENAVKQFQRYNGLNIDGVAGPATLRTLLEGPYPFGS
ncbi:MAG: peptidoglycan-binding protein, partial [Clostridia bacterium]|nr:peptidoglycan-binding protein [Clostridia bacterium]